jgi:hypothetical protein
MGRIVAIVVASVAKARTAWNGFIAISLVTLKTLLAFVIVVTVSLTFSKRVIVFGITVVAHCDQLTVFRHRAIIRHIIWGNLGASRNCKGAIRKGWLDAGKTWLTIQIKFATTAFAHSQRNEAIVAVFGANARTAWNGFIAISLETC